MMQQYPPQPQSRWWSTAPVNGSTQVVSALDLSCQSIPHSPPPRKLSYPYLSLLLSTLFTAVLSLYFLLCATSMVCCVVDVVKNSVSSKPQLLGGVTISLMLTLFYSLFYLQAVAASTKPRSYSSYFRVLGVTACRLLSRDPHHRLLYLHWYQHGLLSYLLRLDLLSLLLSVLPISLVARPGQLQSGSGVLDWLTEILGYASTVVCGLFAAELLLALCARCSSRSSSGARGGALWQKASVAPTVRWQNAEPLLPADAMLSSEHSGPPPAYEETEEGKERQHDLQQQPPQQPPQQPQRVRAEGEAERQHDWPPQAEQQQQQRRHADGESMTAPTVIISPQSDEQPQCRPPAASLSEPRVILSPAMQDDVDDSRPRPPSQLQQQQQQRDPVPRHAVVRMSAV